MVTIRPAAIGVLIFFTIGLQSFNFTKISKRVLDRTATTGAIPGGKKLDDEQPLKDDRVFDVAYLAKEKVLDESPTLPF
jgi:hypothetical protein